MYELSNKRGFCVVFDSEEEKESCATIDVRCRRLGVSEITGSALALDESFLCAKLVLYNSFGES